MEFDLERALAEYTTDDETEKECVQKTIDFLKNSQNCFSRTNLEGHITAGALIMDENGYVLINHHKALDRWVFFGGHSDGEANSLNVAKREIMEECGITELDDLNGKIIDIDVHVIPENVAKHEPEHHHYDIRFLFIVKNRDFAISDESKEAKWMTISEAKELMKDQDKIRTLDKAYKIYLQIKKEKAKEINER